MNKRLGFILFLFLSTGAQGQDSTVINFFPYQTGDFWVYEQVDLVKQEVVNEIKYRAYADSTDSTGTRWVFAETNDHSRIDSVYYKVRENGDVLTNDDKGIEALYLKYEVTETDSFWVGGAAEVEGYYFVFQMKGTSEVPFFGKPRQSRTISSSITQDTVPDPWGSVGGLEYEYNIWTQDFGVTGFGGYEDHYSVQMKGAWKEGTVYGDTTFNKIVVDTLRTDFFPYHTGDFWVYRIIKNSGDSEANKAKVKYKVYADSIDADSTKWVYVEKNVNGMIDSVYYKVAVDGDIYSDDLVGKEMLKFKFKGVSKYDYWVGGELENGMYGVYELRTVGVFDVSNTPQAVSESRSIYFYEMPDTTCCNSQIFRENWVGGFGIVGVNYFTDPNVQAWDITGIYKNGQVYGDTTFAIITSNEIEQDIPDAFTLRQNYPNPFNPSTVIEYEVSRPTYLSATLYTYTGQKIAEIYTNKFHHSGVYALRIDQRIFGNLASSLLILRVQSQTEVQALKMMYLK